LREANTATPNFTPDDPGDYIVSLTVTDAQGLPSAPDTVTITVQPINQTPKADAGLDQTQAAINQTVALDGSASSDPENSQLTYSWSFQAQPTGGQAVLSDETLVSPSFTPDVPGDYIVSLTVRDAQNLPSVPDTVNITVPGDNKIPDAKDIVIQAMFSDPEISGNVLDDANERGDEPVTVTRISDTTGNTGGFAGNFNLEENGDYTFLPPSSSPVVGGTVQRIIKYRITDRDDEISEGQLTFRINP
jgi:PKD repeat protein